MPAQTHLFRCLQDNFGVLVHDPATGATASIDAPEAGPVEAALKQTGWRLTDILVTHHHGDHTGGIKALKEHHHCRVIAPRAEAARIPDVDVEVWRGRRGPRSAQSKPACWKRPAIRPVTSATGSPMSSWQGFVGDTLFSIGCGRVIEGTPEMMWNSLLKLRALPDATKVYCGHEYTAANIRFAKTIEPNNKDLAAREQEVTGLLASNKSTVPSLLGAEKKETVFLRADVPAVAAAVGLSGHSPAEVFAEVRARKNKL